MLKLMPILEYMRACEGAKFWIRERNFATFAEAWAACPRADWMLWLVARSMPREVLVECACDIAEKALVHVPVMETRPRDCIEVTRRWARGSATIEEVREARRGAAYAAYAYADAYAAAAYAAAAAAAADAYADAAYAAAAAAAADAYADADAARHRDIVGARVQAALIERALYDYAQAHGCVVEVSP